MHIFCKIDFPEYVRAPPFRLLDPYLSHHSDEPPRVALQLDIDVIR